MKKLLIVLLFGLICFNGYSQCTHSIDLTDTWGDGWEGGTVTVKVNGVAVLTNITLASGSGPSTSNFTASAGDIINVTRTADGGTPSEMRIKVYSGGTTIIATQQPVVAPGTNGTAACPAALPGENCANAQNLASLTSPYSATTVGYADDISVCRTGYSDRIFYINVPNGSTIDIWESTNGYDEYEYMGYGPACPGSTTINCWDNDGLAHNTWTNSTGSDQTVWYVQDAYSGSGTFTLNWTLSTPVNPCSSITTISGCGAGNTQTFSKSGASSWMSTSSCGFSTPGNEHIYQFTAPTTGTYSLQVTSATGGFVDYMWKLASGGCTNTGWTCIDDITGTGAYGSLSWTAGVTYYILLDPEGTGAYNHQFYINCPSAGPCASITTIAGCGAGNTQTFNMSGASSWMSTSSCGFSTPGNEYIYQFTPSTTGTYSLQVTSATGGYVDYMWKLASGGCTNTGWTCIDDVLSTGTYGSLSWTAGVTYYILLDPEGTGAYNHQFYITCPSASPCLSVTPIANCGVSNSQTYTGGGSGAWSTSYCGYSTPGIEQIYSFVAPATGTYSLEVTAADGYVDYGWQASSCAETGWTCIADILSPGTYGSMTWTAGTTYYILLDDENSIAGTHTFYLNCPPCAVAAGTASASPGNFCPGVPGNTTLSLSGEDAVATIQWQVSTNGGTTWANIPGATTDPWVQAVSSSSMYRALVTNGCTSTSVPVSVTYGCSIIQPTAGFASTSIGCGSSYNYYDSGGSGSAYSSNENGLITISPDVAGQYVSVIVNSFNIENGFDYLYVFDGDNASATIIGIYTGTIVAGTTITASSANPSGALSFRFTSDGSTQNAGWNLTCLCTGTAAAPYPTSTQDCAGSIVICDDGPLVGGSTGYGFTELPTEWSSCLGIEPAPGEIESTWYVFSSATDGTIGFDIIPNTQTDYDWAIWGPYTTLQCPTFTIDDPIRCNASHYEDIWGTPQGDINGNTGLASFSNDIIEENGNYAGEVTDQYCRPLTVYAGEIYVMMLDNWEGNAVGFQLNWNLSDGATLDCDPPLLPVTLSSFYTKCEHGKTILNWTTQSEINNNFFVVQKSSDAKNFKEIGIVNGAGTSNLPVEYSFIDYESNNQLAYYRLLQVDYDGSVEYHRIVTSNCFKSDFEVVSHQLSENNLDLTINCFEVEDVTIYLYDLQGRLIIESNKQLNLGNNIINLNNFNINSGIYLLNIVGDIHNYQTKIIRQ